MCLPSALVPCLPDKNWQIMYGEAGRSGLVSQSCALLELTAAAAESAIGCLWATPESEAPQAVKFSVSVK